MRYLIIAQFLLISLFSMGQDSLPNNNKLVIQFINDNYGEKVGSGICSDLMYKAWEYVDSINGFRDSIMDDIKASEIIPGDIIEFDSVLCADGHFINKHMGIVYRVSPNGLLSIAEQNVGSMEGGSTIIYRGEPAPLVKDSHVKFSLFDMSGVVSGKIYFYRI